MCLWISWSYKRDRPEANVGLVWECSCFRKFASLNRFQFPRDGVVLVFAKLIFKSVLRQVMRLFMVDNSGNTAPRSINRSSQCLKVASKSILSRATTELFVFIIKNRKKKQNQLRRNILKLLLVPGVLDTCRECMKRNGSLVLF